jgi:hypothetical protein
MVADRGLRATEDADDPLRIAAAQWNLGHVLLSQADDEQDAAVSVEMLDGDAVEGLRLADQVDIGWLPSRERQFTFGLEVARCYDLRREDAAVLVHLLELEDVAPEDLERSQLTRELVTSLVQRARPTYRRQATALAARLDLL